MSAQWGRELASVVVVVAAAVLTRSWLARFCALPLRFARLASLSLAPVLTPFPTPNVHPAPLLLSSSIASLSPVIHAMSTASPIRVKSDLDGHIQVIFGQTPEGCRLHSERASERPSERRGSTRSRMRRIGVEEPIAKQ